MNSAGQQSAILKQKQIDAIRDSAAKAEKDGKITKVQSGLITEQNWFKILAPVTYGGGQTALPELMETLEALAWADGSFGWTVARCALAGWSGGFLAPGIAKDILGGDKACVAGSSDATGTAEKTKAGYTISGKWQHVAGAADATAFVVDCAVSQGGAAKDDAKKGQVLSFVLLKDEVNILSEGNPMGLVAASSNDIEVKNLKVPAARAFNRSGEDATANARIYYFPQLQLSEAAMAVTIAGMATRFVELCEAMLGELRGTNGAPLATDNMVQDTLEKYVGKMNDARVKLYYAAELSWQACVNQQPIKDTILYKVSAGAQDLTRKARECVDALYPFCGVAAMDRSSEINRVWRDLHAASHESLLVFGGL